MNVSIVKNVGNSLGRVGLQLKKHSPEMLVVGGVVGVVASAVMACKATTKASDILEETKEQIDKVHAVLENEDIDEDVYSEEDSKKDLAIIYAQTAWKFVKLYGPSIGLGILSIGAILASNNILRQRNVALAAAYATIDRNFKGYRKRVVERFGEEIDRELKNGFKVEKITETVVDENGKEKKVKTTVTTVDPNGYSAYARVFDDGNLEWKKDPGLNMMFLKSHQQYANDVLNSRGHVFLNEVYDMLGFPRTQAGQIVGWVKDGNGDGYVDFGIYDIRQEKVRDFINGWEPALWLDFNVDGVIYDLI